MTIKTPWSMTDFAYVDAIIARLKERVGSAHPLFLHDIFVAAVSNEPEAALLEINTDDGLEYAVVYYRGDPEQQKDRSRETPKVVYLKDTHDVQTMIDTHHQEWLAKYAVE